MTDTDDIHPSRKPFLDWLAAGTLTLLFVGVILIFRVPAEGAADEVSSNFLFMGRFHPIFVHLPVGVLSFVLLLELISLTKRGEAKWGETALLALLVGSAGAVLATAAGLMLAQGGGFQGGTFTLHLRMGILGTAGILLALFLRLWGMSANRSRVLMAHRIVFFLSFAVMGLGAHFGGNLVHGSRYLTQHAPAPIADQIRWIEDTLLSWVTVKDKLGPGKPPTPPTQGEETPTLVFSHLVLPILEEKCNNCHNEDKSKGDLRLDSLAMILQGGEFEGPAAIAGNSAGSPMITRVLLPLDDDEHMPPEGKDQLLPEELALLRWWIDQGASETMQLEELSTPSEIQPLIERILKPSTP
jgi:uncharacterized membrane protein